MKLNIGKLILTIAIILIQINLTKQKKYNKEQLKEKYIELKQIQFSENGFHDLKQDHDLMKSNQFLEKEISTTFMGPVYNKLSLFLRKHDLETQIGFNTTLIDQIPDYYSKTTKCNLCKKEFKNVTFTHFHYMRKHFPASLDYSDEQSLDNQVQFLILNQACSFLDCYPKSVLDEDSNNLNSKQNVMTKEEQFRKCVYFFSSHIVQKEGEIIDFCFDIVFYDIPNLEDDSSDFWESFKYGITFLLFLGGTGIYYYFTFFMQAFKKSQESHQGGGGFGHRHGNLHEHGGWSDNFT
ncbi:hypothetical protein PPERSA_07539 [Pseudocohnilembus persalinus]|uniref:C2H2-type domain-containing protein n=1 Tax=Pseudocohnilembus persalinus TaxID=266149 RepID=A0A0V0R0B5_PSEPJ|nr:hypothetical protein PPERSA_07539 [Pseudocohnilembus persalinus]|eukprot:KRX07789.1 hypothetical protein PPERSA_07539 [Pseudocohnilembus persalinus]